MSLVIPVFQFEVRYSPILNFSSIYRKLLSPYVRLGGGLKIENQNTLEERLFLNFEEDNYFITVNWDRMVIRGQGGLKTYTSTNSPIQMPFFDILKKMMDWEEFGIIKNVLLAINFIKKLEIEEDNLYRTFISQSLKEEIGQLLKDSNDAAIHLVKKSAEEEVSINYGPYFGSSDLLNRTLYPVNLDSLGDLEFQGIMMEYKALKYTSSTSFKEFVALTERATKIFDKTWKTL